MSLYYDAVSVLTAPTTNGGSFKSRIYNSKTRKSSPAQVFALVTEASKWDVLLKEVIENAGILPVEPKVSWTSSHIPNSLCRMLTNQGDHM